MLLRERKNMASIKHRAKALISVLSRSLLLICSYRYEAMYTKNTHVSTLTFRQQGIGITILIISTIHLLFAVDCITTAVTALNYYVKFIILECTVCMNYSHFLPESISSQFLSFTVFIIFVEIYKKN